MVLKIEVRIVSLSVKARKDVVVEPAFEAALRMLAEWRHGGVQQGFFDRPKPTAVLDIGIQHRDLLDYKRLKIG